MKLSIERTSTVPLTYKDVAEILKIIDAGALEEISIEVAGAKIHVSRSGRGGLEAAPSSRGPAAPAPNGLDAAHLVPEPARPPAAPAAPGPDSSAHAVRAPMLGTFYRAPSPNDPPFVEVGSVVRRGDPICLIEVMKLFTTISADTDGRIASVLPENGQLVEFDQVLFVIEPK